jgi:hypothetical protein
MSEYVIGDLVAFENLKVESIENADMNDVGVIISTAGAPSTYEVYWFKTKKTTSNLAPHLKLLYTIEEG